MPAARRTRLTEGLIKFGRGAFTKPGASRQPQKGQKKPGVWRRCSHTGSDEPHPTGFGDLLADGARARHYDVEMETYDDTVPVPRMVRFPVELRPPPGFRPEDPSTWPRVPGRLEYVDGRLVFMTPSGDIQQDVTGSVAGLLDRWLDDHPEFTFGTNEAGMILDGEVRAADAAV